MESRLLKRTLRPVIGFICLFLMVWNVDSANDCGGLQSCSACISSGSGDCVWCAEKSQCIKTKSGGCDGLRVQNAAMCSVASVCPMLRSCKLCHTWRNPDCGWCFTNKTAGADGSCMDRTGSLPKNGTNCTSTTNLTKSVGECNAINGSGSAVVNYTNAEIASMVATLFGLEPKDKPEKLNKTEAKSVVDKIKSSGSQSLRSDSRFQQFVDVQVTLPTEYIQRSENASRIRITNFGNCSAAVIIAVSVGNATAELNVTVPSLVPLLAGMLSLLLSSYSSITFDINCTSATAIGICRFDDADDKPQNCTRVSSIVNSTVAGFCTVTSTTTSSFVAFAANGKCNSFDGANCPWGTQKISDNGKDCAGEICTSSDCCVGTPNPTCSGFTKCGGGNSEKLIDNPASKQCATQTCTKSDCCSETNSTCAQYSNCTRCASAGTGCAWCAVANRCVKAQMGWCSGLSITEDTSLCTATANVCSLFTDCRVCLNFPHTSCQWCPATMNGTVTLTPAECMATGATCGAPVQSPSGCPAAPSVLNSTRTQLRNMVATLFGVEPKSTLDGLSTADSKALVDKIKGFGSTSLKSDERYQQFVDVADSGVPGDMVQRVGSSSQMKMKDFGTNCQAAVIASTSPSSAFTELNLTIPSTVPGVGIPKWLSDIFSITRFDDNGNLVKNTPVKFEVQCASPSAIGVCRFDSQSPVCAQVTEIIYSVMPGFCTVTSPTTSAFGVFEASAFRLAINTILLVVCLGLGALMMLV